MRIKEKINMNKAGLTANGPITVVAFGDSVTHGAVGFGEIDYDSVYHRRLARMISSIRSYVPVNVINSGIGGITAKASVGLMESRVFAHRPDLVIVCFGLNDINGSLEDYIEAMRAILSECVARGIETVLLTPNMLNTYVADDCPSDFREYAKKTAKYQTMGRMDEYMDAVKRLARGLGVKVADCYGEWRKMSATQDTTALLANRINHPIREMHQLFAEKIFEVIFDGEIKAARNDSTLYRD